MKVWLSFNFKERILQMKYVSLIVLGLMCSACSSTYTRSAPFVTNISGDRNHMVIEKCQIEYKWGLGVITTENCYTQEINMK